MLRSIDFPLNSMQKFGRVVAYFQDYIPKSILSWRKGYSVKSFISDLISGSSVGIISLPLAMAFAISSGVSPERGLFTAIVAGFLISLLGGSRLQIGGPTGAFIVLIYGVVERHGYEGLAVATFLAGFLLIGMGLLRFGSLLKFIPYPVIVGFTTGIALVIFSGQIKDFLGLSIPSLPPDFIGKWSLYIKHFSSYEIPTFALAFASLVLMAILRKFFPRLPSAIIVICLATLFTMMTSLPFVTIEDRYGPIPHMLPMPHLPSHVNIDLHALFPDVIAIALLAGIESLLSCVIADGIAGTKHRSNSELVGQGIANICSSIFGGIPATGAIARTTANVQLGAKSPLSGIVHALTIFLLMFLMAPFAGKIPLAALAAVLVMVAWSMSELPHFIEIVRGPKDEAIVCLLTFLLTLLFDLTVAVQAGVVLAAFLFIKKMSSETHIKGNDHDQEVRVFELNGPLFFGVASSLNEMLSARLKKPKVIILSFALMPVVDLTGMRALEQFANRCKKEGIPFLLVGIQGDLVNYFERHSIRKVLKNGSFFENLDSAKKHASTLLLKDEI